MARTLYFPDGTKEVVFCGDDAVKQMDALECIIRERLGKDTAELLHSALRSREDDLDAVTQELRSYEGSCESYRSCLQDVCGGLAAIRDAIPPQGRFDRHMVLGALNAQILKIQNEL